MLVILEKENLSVVMCSAQHRWVSGSGLFWAYVFCLRAIHIILCLIQVQPRKRPNLTEKLLIVTNIDVKTVVM